MCMGGGGGKAPEVKAAPMAPTVTAPITAESSSQAAGDLERRRRKAAQGRSDTILTGGLGLSDTAQTGKKQLLGQ